MKSILLVIDVQNGFINSSTENTKNEIVDLLKSKIFDIIIATKFINNNGSNFEKILKWNKLKDKKEQQIDNNVENYIDYIIEKEGYSAYTNELKNILKRVNGDKLPSKLYLVGFDTDGCVLATAIDLLEAGIKPIILEKYCSSTGGEEYNKAGIRVLKRVVGEYNIVLEKNITKEFIEKIE